VKLRHILIDIVEIYRIVAREQNREIIQSEKRILQRMKRLLPFEIIKFFVSSSKFLLFTPGGIELWLCKVQALEL